MFGWEIFVHVANHERQPSRHSNPRPAPTEASRPTKAPTHPSTYLPTHRDFATQLQPTPTNTPSNPTPTQLIPTQPNPRVENCCRYIEDVDRCAPSDTDPSVLRSYEGSRVSCRVAESTNGMETVTIGQIPPRKSRS